MKYKRILLKISGESLVGEDKSGFDVDFANRIVSEIVDLHASGVSICIVIGGGNIVRGTMLEKNDGVDRVTADHMGMMGTIINALLLQNIFEKRFKINCRVMSALYVTKICEPYICRKATRHLEKNRIVICAAGTGNPFFSTDTAAVLRAVEMQCEAILKGTKTDGVYSGDPKKSKNVEHFQKISYDQVIKKNLQVMDAAAIVLAREYNKPIIVFSIFEKNMMRSILFENIGKCTIIS